MKVTIKTLVVCLSALFLTGCIVVNIERDGNPNQDKKDSSGVTVQVMENDSVQEK